MDAQAAATTEIPETKPEAEATPAEAAPAETPAEAAPEPPPAAETPAPVETAAAAPAGPVTELFSELYFRLHSCFL